MLISDSSVINATTSVIIMANAMLSSKGISFLCFNYFILTFRCFTSTPLTFLVVPLKVAPTGWSEGECKGKAGWFPSAYIARQEKAPVSKIAEANSSSE